MNFDRLSAGACAVVGIGAAGVLASLQKGLGIKHPAMVASIALTVIGLALLIWTIFRDSPRRADQISAFATGDFPGGVFEDNFSYGTDSFIAGGGKNVQIRRN